MSYTLADTRYFEQRNPYLPVRSSRPQYKRHEPRRTAEDLVNLRSKILNQSNAKDIQYSVDDDKDMEVLNKACALDKSSHITSNYWKIPDHGYQYLTLLSSHNDKPYLAISNSSKESNLLIYELDAEEKLLSHHQSISLPDITSLQWLDSVTLDNNTDKDDINFLLSGHNNGVVHLSIIPEPENDVFLNAEIIKRFNHNKHFESTDVTRPSSITKMEISPRRWRSCNLNSLLSLYNSNIFMWETSRSRAPILKHKLTGIKNFNASPCNDGLLGICGQFGILLLDFRAQDDSPQFYVPDSKNVGIANNIKWSPYDSNVLASSYEDGVVKLWDVRMTKNSFAKLEGHKDTVTSIAWSESTTNDLFTSSNDGTIIRWDLSDFPNYTEVEEEMKCGLKVGLNSVNVVSKNGKVELVKDLVSTRQCGTVIPASNNSVTDLINIGDGKVLSIDGSSFLGLHGKAATKVQQSSDKMMNEILTSITTKPPLVEDNSSMESVHAPKTPRNQSSFFTDSETLLNQSPPPKPRIVTTESSLDTLVGSPISFKRRSFNETLPLPYHSPKLDSPATPPPVERKPSWDNKLAHKRSLSLFSIPENTKLMTKLRDISGSTLTSKDEDGLLTDLSMEDDFTFKPILPLTVNKVRPAFY